MPKAFLLFISTSSAARRGSFFAPPQPPSPQWEGFFGFAEWKMRSDKWLLLEEKLAAKLTDEVDIS